MERRARKPDREVPLDDDEWSGSLASISTNNPELELLKRTYADAFGGALRDAVKTLDSRLRSVLRMSYVDALSIDQIGAVTGTISNEDVLDRVFARFCIGK